MSGADDDESREFGEHMSTVGQDDLWQILEGKKGAHADTVNPDGQNEPQENPENGKPMDKKSMLAGLQKAMRERCEGSGMQCGKATDGKGSCSDPSCGLQHGGSQGEEGGNRGPIQMSNSGETLPQARARLQAESLEGKFGKPGDGSGEGAAEGQKEYKVVGTFVIDGYSVATFDNDKCKNSIRTALSVAVRCSTVDISMQRLQYLGPDQMGVRLDIHIADAEHAEDVATRARNDDTLTIHVKSQCPLAVSVTSVGVAVKKEKWSMSFDEKLADFEDYKVAGNDQFKKAGVGKAAATAAAAGDSAADESTGTKVSQDLYLDAIHCYETSLGFLDYMLPDDDLTTGARIDAVRAGKAALQLNMAQSYIFVREFGKALAACDTVLGLEGFGHNLKALYRKAQALRDNHDYAEAREVSKLCRDVAEGKAVVLPSVSAADKEGQEESGAAAKDDEPESTTEGASGEGETDGSGSPSSSATPLPTAAPDAAEWVTRLDKLDKTIAVGKAAMSKKTKGLYSNMLGKPKEVVQPASVVPTITNEGVVPSEPVGMFRVLLGSGVLTMNVATTTWLSVLIFCVGLLIQFLFFSGSVDAVPEISL